jgi:hypothetical protein
VTTPLVFDLTAPVHPPTRVRRAVAALVLVAAGLLTAINIANAGDSGGAPEPHTVPADRSAG